MPILRRLPMPRYSKGVKILLAFLAVWTIIFVVSLNFLTVNADSGTVTLHNYKTVFQCPNIEIYKKGTGRLASYYTDYDYLICDKQSSNQSFSLVAVQKIEYDKISLLKYFLRSQIDLLRSLMGKLPN